MAMLHKLAERDPARALALVRRAQRMRPRRGAAFLAQAEALLTARARGWAAAAPLFPPPPRPRRGAAAAARRRSCRPPAARRCPRCAGPRPASRRRGAARCLVYATAFGAEPAPLPVLRRGRPASALPLAHRPAGAGGRGLGDAAAAARRPRPPTRRSPAPGAGSAPPGARAVAPEAEASLCLGPGRRLVGNLDTLPRALAAAARIWRSGATRHGIDWWDLAEAALAGPPAEAGAAPAAPRSSPRPGPARRSRPAARPRRLRHRDDLAPAPRPGVAG